MFEKISNIGVYGDSILKGIQINPVSKKYYINNNIDLDRLREKYSVQIKNNSSFGCTVTKGIKVLKKSLDKNADYDAIIMDYGGNDCNYNWKMIALNPEGEHSPNTPIDLFKETYCEIIDFLKKKGVLPILTTLPPLEPQGFFNWFCKDLNKENVLKWLGEIKHIYYHQESYSKTVEKIALEKQVHLIDLREEFLKSENVKELLCEDGTHPNTSGQKIIASCFYKFANGYSRS